MGMLLIGLAAVLLLTQRKQTPVYQNYPQIPPSPPQSNAQAWQEWASAIIATYGNVAQLWQPGGPFYNVNSTPGIDAPPPGSGQYWV